MDTKLIDVSRVIESQRIGPFQILLGTVLLLTMFVDGFEAQAPGFAAPSIIRDFGVSRAAMTPIFVAGNFGLMIGAILLGILGDRAGRRQTIILGLLVLSLFSFLSTTADSIDELGNPADDVLVHPVDDEPIRREQFERACALNCLERTHPRIKLLLRKLGLQRANAPSPKRRFHRVASATVGT